MKKIFLSAVIVLTFCTAQAQLNTNGLFTKTKDKVKQKTDDKASQEAEKLFTKNNKKEQKNQEPNTSKNETMTDEQTNTAKETDYTGMSKEAYIQALNSKSNRAMAIDRLQGTNQIDIDHYYEIATEIDLANFYPIMQKKGKPTGYEGLNEYDRLVEVYKTYPATYEANFKPLINGTIDGAYQLMKTNKAAAVANLNLAMKMNDACLLVIADMKAALEMKAELEKAIKKIGGEHNKIFTSDFHKKNAGKILFSKEPIVAGKEKPEQFTTNFGPNDYIYGIAYLNGPIREIAKTIDGDQIFGGAFRMNLDGSVQPLIPLEFRHAKTDWDKSYFLIEVRPEPSKAMHREDAVYFATRFADFSPRKHTVAIQLGSYQSSDDFAAGEFKVDWSGGNADKMMADAKIAATRAEENHAKTVELDPAFSKPSYTFKDPALSAANLKKAFMASMPNAVQILKMVTVKENASEDWTFNRNDYGTITNKSTNHFTSFVYKAKDGNCYIHYVAQFLKVATGGGNYANLVKNATGMKDERIACENVK